jgi:two-component system, NarL family, nitrate/nitrite response regulator NarL
MRMGVRIAIVSSNEITREGLRRILLDRNLEVVAVVPSAAALIKEEGEAHSVNLIVVDASSAAEGKGSCREIRAAFPTAKIVLLGEDLSFQTTSDALAIGVDGYLAKAISCGPLACSIELVASGEKVVPSQMLVEMAATNWRSNSDDWLAASSDVRLSNREIEVLQCLTRGDSNKVISRELDITEATVKIHIKAIMRKLKVQNRTQAALWAMCHGGSDTARQTPKILATDMPRPAAPAVVLSNGRYPSGLPTLLPDRLLCMSGADRD